MLGMTPIRLDLRQVPGFNHCIQLMLTSCRIILDEDNNDLATPRQRQFHYIQNRISLKQAT
jgi:hypothetical protein